MSASSYCGCPQTGTSDPVFPVNGAIISDDRYFSLLTAPRGQLLLVPKGSNAQAFLTGASGFTGFVMYANGEVSLVNAPALTLPVINPAVSSVYPPPGTFKYLFTGTGEPAAWGMVAAPTTGVFVLQSQNGSFQLVDASSIPGIDQIGQSGTTVAKGGLMMLVNTSGTHYALQRLAVAHRRVVVGDIDGTTGASGYKSIGDTETLFHPTIQTNAFQFKTLQALDSGGNLVSTGLELAAATGSGAVTDGLRLFYSPGAKKLMLSPAQTVNFTQVTTVSASITPPTDFAAMPSGHGGGVSLNYNYANVRIDFQMNTAANETLTLGLYRDGILLQQFPATNETTFSFTFVDQGNPLGAHTYDVRWKLTSGSTTGAVVIQQSFFLISTLGY